jgi:hypothetical protein
MCVCKKKKSQYYGIVKKKQCIFLSFLWKQKTATNILSLVFWGFFCIVSSIYIYERLNIKSNLIFRRLCKFLPHEFADEWLGMMTPNKVVYFCNAWNCFKMSLLIKTSIQNAINQTQSCKNLNMYMLSYRGMYNSGIDRKNNLK